MSAFKRIDLSEYDGRLVDGLRDAYDELDRIGRRLPNWRTIGADLTDLPWGDAEVLVDTGGFRCVARGARVWRGVAFWDDDNVLPKVLEGHRWVYITEILEGLK